MGLLLAGCQRSLDKIVIKCNQKKTEAIFHRIKITGKLEIVDGKGDGMTKRVFCENIFVCRYE